MNDCASAFSENEFYLAAFSTSSMGQLQLFLCILVIYLIAVLGNLAIIFLVFLVPKLHTPMYFFLCNLAILDVASISTSIPKMLVITMTQEHRISFRCCLIQMFFFMIFIDGEAFMLVSMAYDRYVAICKPLQYYTIMRKNVYIVMAASAWILPTLNSVIQTILTSVLQFCHSHEINHFFCELNSVIAVSSSNIISRQVFIFCEAMLFNIAQFMFIILSYIFIFSAILKIRSSAGHMKAFSSCASHLITVILFYGPLLILYLTPESEGSERDKLLSMLFLVAVPMLNPLVYSLRNKEVWGVVVTVFK